MFEYRRRPGRLLAVGAAVLLCLQLPLLRLCAQDPEDPRPGLLQTLVEGNHITSEIVFRAGARGSDQRLDGRFSPEVTGVQSGLLLVREPGDHQFHATISGEVEVLIDGHTVLKASGDNAFQSGGVVALTPGDHQFEVRYRNRDGGVASAEPGFRLFWSASSFTLEPIPPECLSHEPINSEAAATSAAVGLGRQLTDALRCSACHTGWGPADLLAAPDLSQAVKWSDDASMRQRLTSASSSHGMPAFGFSDQQAADITAWLRSGGAAAADAGKLTLKAGDQDAGKKLLLGLGCSACHQSGPDETRAEVSVAYGGPALFGDHLKRSAEWIDLWLRDPGKINPEHRMPVFSLTAEERRQLAAVLSKGDNAADRHAGQLLGDVARGAALVRQSRCGSCHKLPEQNSATPLPFRTLAGSVQSDRGTCISGPADPLQGRPAWALSESQQQAIRAWFSTVTVPVEPVVGNSDFVLHRNGCLSCHDRDAVSGLSAIAGTLSALHPELRGRSEDLIPPALTAIGDRLRDPVLKTSVQGKSEVRRLPWLLTRMPQFRMSDQEVAQLTGLLIAEDRIPASADSIRSELFAGSVPWKTRRASSTELLEGNHLAGAAGFNCIACHSAGKFAPRNVAPGTRGSDLMLMGSRIRPQYFLRWMRNPIRVLRGIEMPAIRRPVAHDPPQTLPEQFVTLWRALADSEFVPPTVVSRYEQTVAVQPGESPRIIRDVFLEEGAKVTESTARAMAVGLKNRLSVLFDLDRSRLKSVVYGEFARQRTEGKSWFWDLAGVPVFTTSEANLLPRLMLPDGTRLEAVADESRLAELLDWRRTERGVVFRQRFYFGEAATADESPHSARTAWNSGTNLSEAVLRISIEDDSSSDDPALRMVLELESGPPNAVLEYPDWQVIAEGGLLKSAQLLPGTATARDGAIALEINSPVRFVATVNAVAGAGGTAVIVPPLMATEQAISSIPGFAGTTLPLPARIMPVGMTWLPDGRLGIASLRGRVWLVRDSDGDQIPDTARLFADGFASPYGILADGPDLLLATKPEIVRLRTTAAGHSADSFEVVASGWGFSADYHDWTTGLVRDADGSLYVGLGSDYSQKGRDAKNDRWRGTVLRVNTDGEIAPVAYSMRFPMGLAFDARGQLFVTDNQGVQNTFNELNHILPGRHYGVPSRFEKDRDAVAETAAIQIPHPWTRSVNALGFFPEDFSVASLAGHAIACEYDTQCLIRMSFQEVDGVIQGGCYRFSRPVQDGEQSDLLGPISISFGPDNALYVGHIRDSGWQGAGNIGEISRLTPAGDLPNGICEIRAVSAGFEIEMMHALSAGQLLSPEDWDIQCLTRVWQGSYGTPDSDRRRITPRKITLLPDQKTLRLETEGHLQGYLYEFRIASNDGVVPEMWPVEGFYTMKQIPR